MLDDVAEIYHTPHNSHSQMYDNAKWPVNKPNEQVRVFEAEWDCQGGFPSDSSLIRNSADCPERLKNKIREHYKRVQSAIKEGKHLTTTFIDFEKWTDIWSQIKTLPDNVKFPETLNGCLYLRSLTTLPDNVKFPETLNGYLGLRSDLRRKYEARNAKK
jgi:hypothetical protein